MDRTELLITFSRVPDYLRDAGRPYSASPAGDLIQCRYEDAQVSSVIAMRALRTTAGSDWIALSVPLGPAPQFRPRASLVANDDLPIGALSDWQGLMLLRQTLPLHSLSFEQLDRALHVLAHTGARLAAAAAERPTAGESESTYGYLFR